MNVPSSTATQMKTNTETSQQTSQKTASASLDYTAFLRLLIAQMQNQDPTNPTDPAEWMGQIASFSNVEQSIQANAKLDALISATSLNQIDGLIGRTLTATTDEGQVSGKVASVRIVSGGVVAILEDGTRLLVGEGVEIS